jgi:hypothetical protein
MAYLRKSGLRRWPLVLVAAFMWWPITAAAQTFVCPNGPGPGEIQIGTTGGSGGVAVIPICASDGSENSSEPAHAEHDPVVWETRWGAIATGSSGWGAVTDMRSEKRAKKAALKQCKKTETGSKSKCKALTYYNQCAVVVIPSRATGHFFQSAIDLPTATSIGMRSCNSQYDECEVYYSGCSYPKRID